MTCAPSNMPQYPSSQVIGPLEVQLIPGTESKLVTGKSTHDDSGSGCGS